MLPGAALLPFSLAHLPTLVTQEVVLQHDLRRLRRQRPHQIVPCPSTVPLGDAAFAQLPLWSARPPDLGPLSDLGHRALPFKCKTRTFHRVYQRFRQDHPQEHDVLLGWFRLSLLGHYSHVSPAIRSALSPEAMDVFLDPATPLEQWLEQSPKLVVMVVREHMIYCWTRQPGLLHEVRRLLDWDLFCRVTIHCMDRVRMYFSRAPRVPVPEDVFHLFADAQRQLIPAAPMRWRPPFMQFFLRTPELAEQLHPGHRDAIEQWVKRLPRHLSLDELEHHLLYGLGFFGVPRLVRRRLHTIRLCHDVQDDGKRRMDLGVDSFTERHPYATQLVRYFCAQWRIHGSVRVYPLDAGTARREWDATRKRYGTGDGVIPEVACAWYCTRCFHLLSLVDHVKKKREHAAERNYRAGFASVMLNPVTRRLSCPWKKQGQYRCNGEVAHVPLMGCVAHIHGTTVRFCSRCFFPSTVRGVNHPTLPTGWDTSGFVCSICVQSAQAEARKRYEARNTNRFVSLVACMFCHHRDRSGKTLFCYPMGFVVCAKHHTQAALSDLQIMQSRPQRTLKKARQLLARHVHTPTRQAMGLAAPLSSRQKRWNRKRLHQQRAEGRQKVRTRYFHKFGGH